MASMAPLLSELEALVTQVSTLDSTGVSHALRDCHRVRSHLEAIVLTFTAHADHLAAEGASPDGAELYRRATKSSRGEAQRVRNRAQTAAAHPAAHAALADGSITAEHLDAIGNAERTLNSDAQHDSFNNALPALVGIGTTLPADEFSRRAHRQARQARTDDGVARLRQQQTSTRMQRGIGDDGMYWLRAWFDPERGARLFTALDKTAALIRQAEPGLDAAQAEAAALYHLAMRGHRTQTPPATEEAPSLFDGPGGPDGPGGSADPSHGTEPCACGGFGAGHASQVEIVAFIDYDSLRNGLHEHTRAYTSGGADLPVSTIRRLCCEALIIPMVLDSDGMPLDVGRGQRLANRAQRRALRKLHRTCAFPDCTVRFDCCEIHHVQPWELGGPTDLANLVPLCSRHHHLVHEGGWGLTMSPDRTIRTYRPDGTPDLRRAWTQPHGEEHHSEEPPWRQTG